jgi:hypothetical protein
MVLVIISLITVTVLGVFHTAVTTNKLQKSAFSSWFRLITNENLWHPSDFYLLLQCRYHWQNNKLSNYKCDTTELAFSSKSRYY